MNALEVRDLKKVYKNNVKALEGISFKVEKGDFFALLGPNGAGKTTCIGIVTSLVNRSSGEVKVFGKDLDKDKNEVKEMIGLVPQEFNFNIFEKVLDIVVQQAGYYGIERKLALKRAEELLKKLGLWEKRNMESMTLSGGMKRKLMIVRALLHKPRLLILDEPTAGVDVETRREIWKFFEELNKDGTTIILTTHYLEEAEDLCKNIVIIDNGRIKEDTSMKSLLTTLDVETFILDVKKFSNVLKACDGYEFKKIDDITIEVNVPREKNLNEFVICLDNQGVQVMSMRNKVNRLEELFVKLVKK
ncbi:MAG: ABC transporter ATP-binding protein [Nanoarchaeota archaeon]|nr:ABC transporter ATP-binding protein [Nanoarchaeota archaeon]